LSYEYITCIGYLPATNVTRTLPVMIVQLWYSIHLYWAGCWKI